MREKRSRGKSLKAQRRAAVRASITFPPDLYENREEIAKQKKVSLAWVVRNAAESYVARRSRRQRESRSAPLSVGWRCINSLAWPRWREGTKRTDTGRHREISAKLKEAIEGIALQTSPLPVPMIAPRQTV